MVVSRNLPLMSVCTSPTRLKNLSGDEEVAGTVRYCLVILVESGNCYWYCFHRVTSEGLCDCVTSWTCMYAWRWVSPSTEDTSKSMDTVIIPKTSSKSLRCLTCPSESFTSPWVDYIYDTTSRILITSTCFTTATTVIMCSGSFPDHVFWTWQMSESLPRVVLGVRKTTTSDEEFKIIVFSPSFVLHYINEVLWLVSLGHLKYVHTGVYHSWFHTCGGLTHTLSTPGLTKLDVSLKDFIPTSSESVLPLLPLSPSGPLPYSFFHYSSPLLQWVVRKTKK